MSQEKTKKKDVNNSMKLSSSEEDLAIVSNKSRSLTRYKREVMLGDARFSIRTVTDKKSKTKSSKDLESFEDAVKNFRDRRFSKLCENDEKMAKKVGYAKNLKKLMDFSSEAYDRSLRNCLAPGELHSAKRRPKYTIDASHRSSMHEKKNFPDLERLYSAESIRAFSDAISVLSQQRAEMNRKYLQSLAERNSAERSADKVKTCVKTKRRICPKILWTTKSKKHLSKHSSDVLLEPETFPQYSSGLKSEQSSKYSIGKKPGFGAMNFKRFGGKKLDAGGRFKRYTGKRSEVEILSSSDTDDDLNNLKNDLKLNDLNELNDEDLKELYDTASNHSRTSNETALTKTNYSDEENSAESSGSEKNLNMSSKRSETNLFLRRGSKICNVVKNPRKHHHHLTQSVSSIKIPESDRFPKCHAAAINTTKKEQEDKSSSKSNHKLIQDFSGLKNVESNRMRNFHSARNGVIREERENRIEDKITVGENISSKSRCKLNHENGKFLASSLEVIKEERINRVGASGKEINFGSRREVKNDTIREERVHRSGTSENGRSQNSRDKTVRDERLNLTRGKCSRTDVTGLKSDKLTDVAGWQVGKPISVTGLKCGNPPAGLQLGSKSSINFCHMIAKTLPDAKIIPFEKLAEILPEDELAKVNEKIDKNIDDKQVFLPGLFEDTQSHIDRIKQQVLKKAKECLPTTTFSKINQFLVSNKSETCLETQSNDETGFTSYSTPSLTTKYQPKSSNNDLKPLSHRRSGRPSVASHHGGDGSHYRYRKFGGRNVSSSYYDHLYSVYSDTGAGKRGQQRLRGKTRRKYPSENKLDMGTANRFKIDEIVDQNRASRAENVSTKYERKLERSKSNEYSSKVCRIFNTSNNCNVEADNFKFRDGLFICKCNGHSSNCSLNKDNLFYNCVGDENNCNCYLYQLVGFNEFTPNVEPDILVYNSNVEPNLELKKKVRQTCNNHEILYEAGDCSFEKSCNSPKKLPQKGVYKENIATRSNHIGPDRCQNCNLDPCCCIFDPLYQTNQNCKILQCDSNIGQYCDLNHQHHNFDSSLQSGGQNVDSYFHSPDFDRNCTSCPYVYDYELHHETSDLNVVPHFHGSENVPLCEHFKYHSFKFFNAMDIHSYSADNPILEKVEKSFYASDKESEKWRGLYEPTDECDDSNNKICAYLASKILNFEVLESLITKDKLIYPNSSNSPKSFNVDGVILTDLEKLEPADSSNSAKLLKSRNQLPPQNNLVPNQTWIHSISESGFWSLKFKIDAERSLHTFEKDSGRKLKSTLSPKKNRLAGMLGHKKVNPIFKKRKRKIPPFNGRGSLSILKFNLPLRRRKLNEKGTIVANQNLFLKSLIYRNILVHVTEMTLLQTDCVPLILELLDSYGLICSHRSKSSLLQKAIEANLTDNLCKLSSKFNDQLLSKSVSNDPSKPFSYEISRFVRDASIEKYPRFKEQQILVRNSLTMACFFNAGDSSKMNYDFCKSNGSQTLHKARSALSSLKGCCSPNKVTRSSQSSKQFSDEWKAHNSIELISKLHHKLTFPKYLNCTQNLELLLQVQNASDAQKFEPIYHLKGAIGDVDLRIKPVFSSALNVSFVLGQELNVVPLVEMEFLSNSDFELSAASRNFFIYSSPSTIKGNLSMEICSSFKTARQIYIDEYINGKTDFEHLIDGFSRLPTGLPGNLRMREPFSFLDLELFKQPLVNLSSYLLLAAFLAYWQFKCLSQSSLTSKVSPKKSTTISRVIQTDLTLIDTELFDTFLLSYILSSDDHCDQLCP